MLRTGTDACTVPVLGPSEAGQLLTPDASLTPTPNAHPKLTRTPSCVTRDSGVRTIHIEPGQHNKDVLTDLGLSDEEIRRLARDGALGKKLWKL